MAAKRENPASTSPVWPATQEVEIVWPQRRTFREECLALSTGWRWSVDHACYVRVRAIEPVVEAAAPGFIPAHDEACLIMVIPWWESPVMIRMVERLEAAREGWRPEVRKTIPIVGYELWTVDAEGKTVDCS